MPLVSRPVCMPVSPTATHETVNSVLTWSSSARRPSLLATRMRRRLSATRADTCLMAPPSARAASSARLSSSTLGGLGDGLGEDRHRVGRRHSGAGEVDDARSPPVPPRAAAAAASAAARRPALGQVGGVGVAGGVADDDSDAGAAVAPGAAAPRSCRRRARADDERRSSAKIFGEVAAGAQRRAQDPLDDGLFDHRGRSLSVVGSGVDEPLTVPRCPRNPAWPPRST